jgi:hypothetical protein
MAGITSILTAASVGLGLSRMMGGQKQADAAPAPAPAPAATATDPAVEQAAADAKAAQNTNAQLAAKTKARKASSLLAAGDPAMAAGITTGKTTLGA